jgi:hypothetical protein
MFVLHRFCNGDTYGLVGDVHFRARSIEGGRHYVPEIATTATVLGRLHWKCVGAPQDNASAARDKASFFAHNLAVE